MCNIPPSILHGKKMVYIQMNAMRSHLYANIHTLGVSLVADFMKTVQRC